MNRNMLLGDDNVIIISGKQTCLVFDQDFDSYLADRALPIKSQQPDSLQRHFDKAGFMDEDVKNILRISIHLQLEKNQMAIKNAQQLMLGKKLNTDLMEYILTEREIKDGFVSYHSIVALKTANKMYLWGSMHNFLANKLSDLSAMVGDIFYSTKLNNTQKL